MSEKPYGGTVPGDVVMVSGYLHKKTRDGRWQKRWFETNGCFLTYYKSKKMTKLLAALDLVQVGTIKLTEVPEPGDEEDLGSLFSIELNERVYTLKAGNDVEAAKWVEVLNQLKVGGSDVMPTCAGNTVTSSMEIEAGGGETEWKKKLQCCGIC
ncbi:hypothetical protein NSK_007515 [Nannochloropsis salina CCMP1776]|uniref:PH domain-containing protein n=1 Tax=Nannochloropsis salina CCMP1776 TaxID=1027361 RepID=A0A4D9CUK8_9STRA|nr:hypothetical protein NSK_007515 [Nannochloropsis salina CCMP1776]|eukprot:TFJ81173.1 hypothetical protein NSK_007515 [Nannochloropsis salina CCMP1776]